MNDDEKRAELTALWARITELETDLAGREATPQPFHGYYTAYYVVTGAMLGMFGAATSLLFNVIGSYVWSEFTGKEQHPLRLIQVYLTFPLGAAALEVNSGVTLAIGSCLYLGTGMVYGVLFHVVQSRFAPNAGFWARMALMSALSLAVWLVNFYLLLSWLQPLLFGGNWIVTEVPAWVAALTHLVFGWTMVLVYPFGVYVPYRVQSEQT
jgi:hypothetical protein